MAALDIGKRLAEFRRQSGKRQTEIAKIADVHNTVLSRIENGYIVNHSLFIKIVEVYKVLLNWTDDEYKSVLESLCLSTIGLQIGNNRSDKTEVYKNYIGIYYLYFPSSKNDGSFTNSRLSVELVNGELTVTEKHSGGFEYHGKVIVSDQNLYLELDGKYHFEKVLHIFNNPLHRNIRKLWGVLSGVSVISEPFTTVCLLTEERLDDSTLQREFDNAHIVKGSYSFKVSRDITLYTDNEEK